MIAKISLTLNRQTQVLYEGKILKKCEFSFKNEGFYNFFINSKGMVIQYKDANHTTIFDLLEKKEITIKSVEGDIVCKANILNYQYQSNRVLMLYEVEGSKGLIKITYLKEEDEP